MIESVHYPNLKDANDYKYCKFKIAFTIIDFVDCWLVVNLLLCKLGPDFVCYLGGGLLF